MDATTAVGGTAGIIVKVVGFILILIVLYYLYNFLYGADYLFNFFYGVQDLDAKILNPGIQNSNMTKPLRITSDNLPTLYEGGEYTVSVWFYVNDYSVRRGYNKHLMTIGGSTFNTLAIYMGPFQNSLSVRVQTQSGSSTVNTGSGAGGSSGSFSSPETTSDNLSNDLVKTLFTTMQTDASLLSILRPCDLQSIELQKWLLLTVVLNNKTCDVYLDGKLARSCVLPSFFKVDKTGLSAKLCDYQGFGGYLGPVNAYNYALNPEQVWRLYMAGPGPQYSLLDYFKSLFDPKSMGTLEYPKMNT